jgi:hypothetical protein
MNRGRIGAGATSSSSLSSSAQFLFPEIEGREIEVACFGDPCVTEAGVPVGEVTTVAVVAVVVAGLAQGACLGLFIVVIVVDLKVSAATVRSVGLGAD